jgi:putative hydrolase of the HAD superfamily
MPPIPIDAYVFDCGRVITFDQDTAKVSEMAALLGTDPETFHRAYVQERLEYDRGAYTVADYWGRVGKAVGAVIRPDMLPRLSELDMASWFNINPAVVDIIEGLRQKARRMLVLSNMNVEGKHRTFGPARYCGTVDWTALFDSFLLSCDLHLVKPEPAIFEACIEAAGTEPGRCLLIDDTVVNIEAARAAGMHAVHFIDAAGLSEALSRAFHPNGA